jgi:Zn-dependent protease with chaperone function
MNSPIISHDTPQLDPFAFPSETDSRFLLLIIAAAGSTLILVDALMRTVMKLGVLPSLLIAIAVTIFIFIWAWHQACQDASKKNKILGLENFPPKSHDPEAEESLRRLADYVNAIVLAIPAIEKISPKFVWDNTDNRPTGMAFGFGKQKIVLLRQGLHTAFTQLPESNAFNAVLLHELGHLNNQDVSKTIFSITLGKIFFPTALTVLGLFDVYIIFSLISRLIAGRSFTSAWEGISLIIEINIKTCILLILVEIIRASILRVREYYADAYAKQYLGCADSLIELFPKENPKNRGIRNSIITVLSQSKQDGILKAALKIWNIVRQEFYSKIAPLHPISRKRVAALMNNRQLFQLGYELAFFSGLLSGLALNSSFVISPAMGQLGAVMLNINQGIKDSDNGIIVLIRFIVVVGIFLIYSLGIILLIAAFGLTPVVSTIGIQLQSASFVDKFKFDKLEGDKLTSFIKLIKVSFILGVGFVLGCFLVPMPNPFSLWNISLLNLTSYILGWTGVFFAWMLPLKILSGRVYAMHDSDEPPKKKRRCLTILSALSLLPLFGAMSIIQIFSSALSLSPKVVAIDHIEILFIILGTLGIILSGFIWAIGWGLCAKKGWLEQPFSEEIRWVIPPSPILLPPLPPLNPKIDSTGAAPPLSFW